MKKIFIVFVLLLQGSMFSQNSFIQQITNGDFDARNPFIYKDEFGFQDNAIFFELHKDSSSNIYYKKYNSSISALEDTVSLTRGDYKNLNPSFHPNIGLIYQTNQNGNWDIAFIPDSAGVWKNPRMLTNSSDDEINPKFFKIVEDYYFEFQDSLQLLFNRNSDIVFMLFKQDQITEQIIFRSDSEFTYSEYVGVQIPEWSWNSGYYIFAIEKDNQGEKRIVRKFRSYDGIVHDKIIIKDNCDCSGIEINYADYGNLGLFYIDTLQGKERYFVIENPVANNPPSFNVPILHEGNLSALDIYFFLIVTEHNEIIYRDPQLLMPHSYLVEENETTKVRFDPIDLGIWERDSLVQISISNSNIAVGNLGTENNQLLIYTVWEDSVDGNIQLFGTTTHMSFGAVDDESIASDFMLYQNYPNPFNPSTNIEYKLLQASDVKFNVFNVLGEKVFEQNFGYQTAGSYNVNFDGKNLPSGVYVYSIYTNENRLSRKMMLMK